MTPAVRNHLMQVLADAGIPENLLAELMKERRGLRDSLVQAALPAIIARVDQGPQQFVSVAKNAYAIADAVLSLRDRSPSYKPAPQPAYTTMQLFYRARRDALIELTGEMSLNEAIEALSLNRLQAQNVLLNAENVS